MPMSTVIELTTGLCQSFFAPCGRGRKETGGHPQAPAKGRLPLRTPLISDLATVLELSILWGKK